MSSHVGYDDDWLDDGVVDLVADCSRCSGLCCVLLPYRASDGFGTDKPGGTPCGHLRDDDLCSIHDHLAASGWPGCAAYDCRGAGQHVTQTTYAGRSWREVGTTPSEIAEMAAVFSVVRVLHGHLLTVQEGSAIWDELVALRDGTPEDLLQLDLDEVAERVAALR